jgi:hypothetical protein
MFETRMSQPRNNGQDAQTDAGTESQAAYDPVDARQQLCNDGNSGSITEMSLPLAMITSLRGIMLDLDPVCFREGIAPADAQAEPAMFYDRVIRKMLARDSALSRAEVRCSGRGLHVIIWLADPVEFTAEGDRQLWAARVKVIQRLLPTDPDCPGITALTRPLGSVNSKNGGTVQLLHCGELVSSEDVVALSDSACASPFKTVARLLFGDEHIKPCPVCNGPSRRLDALDYVGNCYGGCGKVSIGQLYDVFLRDRASRNDG